MATLYKRATPSQQRILRVVEGAIKNACDSHPELQISPQYRRSIAKRAAGTLSAQWVGVLAAAPAPSESGAARTRIRERRRASQLDKAAGRGAHSGYPRFPLRRLIRELAAPLRLLKIAGRNEQVAAYVDVLRLIDQLRRESA